jgi:hypothetical protein
MKTFLLTLATLFIFGAQPSHAAGERVVLEKSGTKTESNTNRQNFGKFIEGKMKDAFDGRLASIYPCGDRPVFYCQGLMVSAFEQPTLYWMDPGTPRISFTYFRKDIATALYGPAGFVLWPWAYVENLLPKSQPGPFHPVYRCAFPLDGWTVSRTDNGCGELIRNNEPSPDSAPCSTVGVTTAQQWVDKYLRSTSAHGGNFCGFSLLPGKQTAVQGINLMVETALLLKKIGGIQPSFPWNEVVMAPWRSASPRRLPLMAFFVIPEGSQKVLAPRAKQVGNYATALDLARAQQKQYYDLSDIFVPIVSLSADNDTAVFTYRDEDQAAGIPNVVNVYPR